MVNAVKYGIAIILFFWFQELWTFRFRRERERERERERPIFVFLPVFGCLSILGPNGPARPRAEFTGPGFIDNFNLANDEITLLYF